VVKKEKQLINMNYKAFLLIVLLTVSALFYFGIQGCKDEAVVEPPPAGGEEPEGPKLLSPVNHATLTNFTPALDWEDFSGASSYRLQLSLDANFAGIMVMDSSAITSSTINIPQGMLTTSSYYYWRVRAIVSGGTSPWSAVWRFHIILAPPGAPNLIAPPNGSVNLNFTPLLDWDEPQTAETYRVQISNSSAFNQIVFDSGGIYISQYQVSMYRIFPNRLYFWRVNASNSGGASTGPWSAPWSFTTMDGPEPNSISGTIIFVDTNFLQPPGFYKVGAFDNWPPFTPPVMFDSLNIVQVGGVYKADYMINRVSTGIYYVAVYPETEIIFYVSVLGIYGCDTVHQNYSSCPQSPPVVDIISNWGVENINFLSWADTTQKIF
jgi:hypothetical protein